MVQTRLSDNGHALLTPDLSPLGRDVWLPFVEDDDTQSYSYYLDDTPHAALAKKDLDRWFRELHPSNYKSEDGLAWTKSSYKGETLLRQTAWCVFEPQCTCEYGYSDTWQPILQSPKMKAILQEITTAVSKIVGGQVPNSCNLNYYPRGGGVGFHADDEFLFDGLQRDVRIISLSLCPPGPKGFGARKFQVRKKEDGEDGNEADPQNNTSDKIHELLLGHGKLITMEGMFQQHYLHSVWPGDSKEYQEHPLTQGERINLTFRTIIKHLDGSMECRGKTCELSKHN